MSDEIRVTVCKYPDRANLVLRFIDPVTGRQKTKSAGTADEGEATKAAGKWEDELRSGRYEAPSRLTWADFRRRYEDEKLTTLAEKTRWTATIAMRHLERVLDPDKLAKLTTANLSRFQSKLRAEGMTDTTIAKNLRHIRAALSWGKSMGMLATVPEMHSPKRQKGAKMMKGRAVSGEEFDRMIAAVPKVRPTDAPAWERLLHGLWLSGLRISEAVALDWDDGPFSVDLTGKHPRFRIEAEGQKSGRNELLPMTPDFAQWLTQTPAAARVGRVFKLARERGGEPMGPGKVGYMVSEIGRTALVLVDKATDKFASAHDLRRSFGTRWASKVMPAVLRRLMRHAAIATTMAYYVDLDADEVAGELWAKFGNTPTQGNILGNIAPKDTTGDVAERGVKCCKTRG